MTEQATSRSKAARPTRSASKTRIRAAAAGQKTSQTADPDSCPRGFALALRLRHKEHHHDDVFADVGERTRW
jgi:hypothetical protein